MRITQLSCQRTRELGGRSDFAQKLDKVREIIAEELGFEDEVLAGVVGIQFSAEKLGFPDNAQC